MTVAGAFVATAFVDWNSQIHARPQRERVSELTLAQQTLTFVAKTVAKSLSDVGNSHRFDVTLRIYHGWRKGFEETVRRKALLNSVASADFLSISNRANVSIRPNVEFGDNLISGPHERFHARIQCHIPNTLRRKIDDPQVWEEKMVDTAIASDVVDTAHREPSRWLVLVGDDDDLVPPAFVAEGARGTADGKIILVRNRPDSPFFMLAGIGYRP